MIRQEDFNRLRRFDDRTQPELARRPVQPLRPVYQASPVERPVRPWVAPAAAPIEATLPESQMVPKTQPVPVPVITLKKALKRPAKHHLAAAGLACLLIAGGAGLLLSRQSAAASPIPANYQTAVDYPTYYPAASELPAGFKLNANSFTTPAKGIIVYTISYGNGQKIDVSLQDKPSNSNLQAFNSQRIPLHTTLQTPVGQAVIGAIGDQAVVSLPTNSKAWIIVTAPYDINSNQLDQLLKSFKS